MSAPRELGLALQTDKAVGTYAALARTAEEAGFDVVTTFNDLWFQPALPALLEIAQATTKVRVGPTCLNPFTLHPVEIAGQIAALDRASHGRAFLGLAAGAWLESLGVDPRRPLETLREAWEVVRRLLAGDSSAFEGKRFALPAGARLRYDLARPEVPLLVGTWSPGLAAFAGTAARELKVGGSANPDVVPVMRKWIGNDDVGIVFGAVTVVDDDGDRARALARREVAMYVDIVAPYDPTLNVDPELLRRIRELVAQGEDAQAGALLSPDLLARFAFAGTPAEVAAHAETLFDAGALRVDFGTPHGLEETRGIELLCREVLPLLRLPWVFDYAARRGRLAERMEAEGIDALFLAPSADLEYLTGVERQIPIFGQASYAHGWVTGAFCSSRRRPVFVFPRMFATFDLPVKPEGEVIVVNETDDGEASSPRDRARRRRTAQRSRSATGSGREATAPPRTRRRLRPADAPARGSSTTCAASRTPTSSPPWAARSRPSSRRWPRSRRSSSPGVSMLELAEAVDAELRRAGSRCPSFTTHMFTGLRPGRASTRALGDGARRRSPRARR